MIKRLGIFSVLIFVWSNLLGIDKNNITLERLDIENAFCNIEKIKNFHEDINIKKSSIKETDRAYWGDIFIALVKKNLGENNFLSFILLNNLFDDDKFGSYELTCKIPHISKQSAYYDRNDLLLVRLDEYEIVETTVLDILDKDSFSNFKVISNAGNEIIGIFDFDLFTIKAFTGKFIFSAIKGKNGKWVVQELCIKKRGSDKLEDGLLVYSRAKDETVNKSPTKDTHQVKVDSQEK